MYFVFMALLISEDKENILGRNNPAARQYQVQRYVSSMLRSSYRKHVRPVKTVISFVHYGGIGKNGHSIIGCPVGLVDVAEEVHAGANGVDPFEQLP